ncbi:hypothetical protein N7468_006637 [Penicillium chermesinum]|uniref:Uncharacterized protein n=1 Tax=Penicillium chermesinum TaxID=63820 RepID=A0A9W9NSL7_9EURO|nr:uncharacterized protein N7468_006637 [Penicillium chermesinum]KAJ5225412.1 hypothetical protein N7468_006637 [Penicillium chermesinum]KAJ6161364.1 hypothetical protein N7470_004760 [Penicillium chermesinum]
MSDSSPRYWRGQPGDRHEHGNVWVPGGPKSPTTKAPWAPTPEMIAARRESDASASSAGAATNEPYLPTLSERRRSSASSGTQLFSNLHTQKRESTDPDAAARRKSYSEQLAKGGMFSKLWDGYTRGK